MSPGECDSTWRTLPRFAWCRSPRAADQLRCWRAIGKIEAVPARPGGGGLRVMATSRESLVLTGRSLSGPQERLACGIEVGRAAFRRVQSGARLKAARSSGAWVSRDLPLKAVHLREWEHLFAAGRYWFHGRPVPCHSYRSSLVRPWLTVSQPSRGSSSLRGTSRTRLLAVQSKLHGRRREPRHGCAAARCQE